MIVLHYTGMLSAEESLARLCDPAAKVSAHYLIDEAGLIYQLVKDSDRAWHAGVAFWAGETDINACSIGIELQNPGHEHGYTGFPDVQIESLIGLMNKVRDRHQIADSRILGHSDVAPARKEDPGELFPWRNLAEHGHGIWSETQTATVPLGSTTAILGKLGYHVGSSDNSVETLQAVLAFQRHHLPNHLTGNADFETRTHAQNLHRLIGDS